MSNQNNKQNNDIRVQIELTITLKTPLSVGTAGSRGGLADKHIMRDGKGHPLIPGSQIKGRLRHACERVASALNLPICKAPVAETMCPDYKKSSITRKPTETHHTYRLKEGKKDDGRQCVVCAIFGSPTYPCMLTFGDALVTEEDEYALEGQLRTGVGLDRRRRTALEQALFVIETTRAGLQFKSTIRGTWYETDRQKVEELIGLLIAGTKLATRWGGGSSRGLGWATVTPQVRINDLEQDINLLVQGVDALCDTN